MTQALLIGLGGAIGTLLRYGSNQACHTLSLPIIYSTFSVNIIGCFLIGVLYPVFNGTHEVYRGLLLIGILGGFTTFSSFALETRIIFIDTGWLKAALYVLLTNIIGLAACGFGAYLSYRSTS